MLFFDIEANGILDDVTKVHCLAIKDIHNGETWVYRTDKIQHGLAILNDAVSLGKPIVAHNGIKYDLPVLQKLYPWFKPDEKYVIDTLVLSRLIYSDIKENDKKLVESGRLPRTLQGKHSLEAWGYRLKLNKAEYQGGWEEWNQDMEDYCVRDVEVLEKLYTFLAKKNYSQEAIQLEHEVAFICAKMERNGFLFDDPKAQDLYSTLSVKRYEAEQRLKGLFGPKFKPESKEPFYPKKDNKARGYTTNVPFTKVKLVEFNPSSRQQIAERLIKDYGWKPKEYTDNGHPQIDEKIIHGLTIKFPYKQELLDYLLLDKRIGQLAEGKNAWLKLVKADGRLHGSIITNGAVTGRCTHNLPNMAQVPSVGKPYGEECRSLFTVPKGRRLVGADLSGLELRCLAHYMALYDKGQYAAILLNKDIHTANQEAAGLPTRADAKTFIYAFIYGAGDIKIGSIVLKGEKSVRKLKAKGAELRAEFLRKTPALKKLISAVQGKVKQAGHLRGLDGRLLPIRKEHAALNTLLQSAGAIIAKKSLVIFRQKLQERNWYDTDRVKLVAFIHDEVQLEADEEIADEVGKLMVESFEEAGRCFNFRCPITGEYKVGNNWAETH